MSFSNLSNSDVNKISIIALVTVAMLIGISPYFVAVKRPIFLIYFVIVVLIALVLFVRSKAFKTFTERVPTLIDFLLIGVGYIFWTAVTSFMGIIIYWLLIGASNLVGYFLAWVKLDIQVKPELIGFYVSFVAVVFYTFVTFFFVTNHLIKQLYLYPQTTEFQSVSDMLDRLFTQRRLQLLFVTTVIALLYGYSMLMVTLSKNSWLHLYWLLNLMYISYPLARQRLLTPKILKVKAVNAVEKLFKAIEYDVVPCFKTGKVEIDPLLVDLDFLATRGKHGFAIKVIMASTSSKITSKAAIFDLLTATWALTDFFKEGAKQPAPYVKPLFVVIASEQFPSFQVTLEEIASSLKKMDLQLVEINSWNTIEQILKLEDKKQLQVIAHAHFENSESASEIAIKTDLSFQKKDEQIII